MLLAIGLAMDAMAVSAAKGVAASKILPGHVLLVACFFGGFQALMPLLWWMIGSRVGPLVEAFGSARSGERCSGKARRDGHRSWSWLASLMGIIGGVVTSSGEPACAGTLLFIYSMSTHPRAWTTKSVPFSSKSMTAV